MPDDDEDRLAAGYAALTAAHPTDLLAPLVAADGAELLSASREDVTYRPGHDAVVRFAATVRRDGAEVREGWVVAAGGAPAPGARVLDGPAGPVSAWRVRDDPDLVGLRSALDADAVAGLLTALGLPPDGVALTLVAVRPRRRAVVEVRTPSVRLFLKCVRPAAVADLRLRHDACREAGVPVPKALAVDEALGLLVLSPLAGTPLRTLLQTAGSALPPPEEVGALLRTLSRVELALPARDPRRHARGHGALLKAVLPIQADRVDAALAAIADSPPGVTGGVHGDFYDAQVLVQDGRVTGLVDVDGAGTGRPADDAGNLLAHLQVLRALELSTAAAWTDRTTVSVQAMHDPRELALSTAAVLLGLATWPHSRLTPDWEAQTGRLLELVDAALSV